MLRALCVLKIHFSPNDGTLTNTSDAHMNRLVRLPRATHHGARCIRFRERNEILKDVPAARNDRLLPDEGGKDNVVCCCFVCHGILRMGFHRSSARTFVRASWELMSLASLPSACRR